MAECIARLEQMACQTLKVQITPQVPIDIVSKKQFVPHSTLSLDNLHITPYIPKIN